MYNKDSVENQKNQEQSTHDIPPKPIPLSINVESIPANIKQELRWVCWRYGLTTNEKGESKWTKVPFCPSTAHKASTTNPATWAAFAYTLKQYQLKLKRYNGIGFMLGNGWAGIDIDDCRQGDEWTIPLASTIVKDMNTYTEVSPSGTGVKMLLKASIGKGRKKGKKKADNDDGFKSLEIYSQARFFTITGNRMPGLPTEPQERQDQAERFIDQYFPKDQPETIVDDSNYEPVPLTEERLKAAYERATTRPYGIRFQELWNGNWEHYPSQSEADLAMVNYLAYELGPDHDAIDCMFRQSGLMRDKWDDPRGSETYGSETIRKVVAKLNKWHGKKSDKEKTADKLKNIIQERCELWHTPDHVAYATVENGANLPVNGSAFAGWIQSINLELTGQGLTKPAIEKELSTCCAIAEHRGREQKVYRRVARIDDRIEIDLGDDSHKTVLIDGDDWTIGKPSVRFVRSDNAAALPTPVHGGSIDLLRPLVNLPADQFPLFIGSILDAYKGHGSYLVSAFSGEQGTSKSTIMRIMRRLIDPCKQAELSACPRDEQDLAIDGTNNYFLPYDNVSKLAPWLSDALCRVSTGGGFKTRKLYTNNEQTILDITRPVALNGIEDFVVAGDLISRSVIIKPDVIPEEKRRDEKALWADFNEIYPLVLGCLFDALSVGLRNVRSVSLPSLPRMADSAKWIAACFPSFGWSYDDWFVPYQFQSSIALADSLEDSFTASILLDWFAKEGSKWEGSMKDLYVKLFACVDQDKERYFPKSPKSLSNKLNRLNPALRNNGVDVRKSEDKERNGKFVGFTYTITKISPVAEPVAVLPTVADAFQSSATQPNAENIGNPQKMLPTLPNFSSLLEKRENEKMDDTIKDKGFCEKFGNVGNKTHHCLPKPAFGCVAELSKSVGNTGQQLSNIGNNHENDSGDTFSFGNNSDPAKKPTNETSMMTLNQYAKYIDETVKGIEAEHGKEHADTLRLACTKDTIKSVYNKLKRENPERLYPKLLDQTCNQQ